MKVLLQKKENSIWIMLAGCGSAGSIGDDAGHSASKLSLVISAAGPKNIVFD